MGQLSLGACAPAKPRRRRTLLHLCLTPEVKDDDNRRCIHQQSASAPGGPRSTQHSPKRVGFNEFPTIHTYCVVSEGEGNTGSTIATKCPAAHNVSASSSGRQHQLLSNASNTCPQLRVQDGSGMVSSGWACHLPAASGCHEAKRVHCGTGNTPVPVAAADKQLSSPFTPLQLSDGQLAMLSRLDVSQQAAQQCDVQQLLEFSMGQQQLGRGTHSEAIQAIIPWPSAEVAVAAITSAAEAARLNGPALSTAVSAGLPVVVKMVVHERFEGDGLFNIEGRKREEKFSRMVSGSMYFPQLYRAIHMKRRSYFLFSTMTAQPITLEQHVQSMQQQLTTSAPAAATSSGPCDASSNLSADSSQTLTQQLQQPVTAHTICSPQLSAGQPPTSNTSAWQDSLLQILNDIAHGLDDLHRLGLLHLDLKPGNIIIREGGHAYLIDLGVACEIGMSLEQHGRCGTAAFMHPEIRFDKDLQGSYQVHHDYYSLGAVALYLVAKGNFKVFLQVQNELDQALLYWHSAAAHCRAAKTAANAVGHVAAARRLLGSQAGVGQGMVDLVIGLMAAPDQRLKNYEHVKDLLKHARKCTQPEQCTHQQPEACPKGKISTIVRGRVLRMILYLAAAALIVMLVLRLTA